MSATRGKLLILTYHRVVAERDALIAGNAYAEGFARQMQVLARAFNVLPLVHAVEQLRAGTLPPRAVSITFDDGYADNATVAAPILARYGLPATFFIATGFVDGGRMWNDTLIETVRAARGADLDLTALGLGHLVLDGVASRAAAVATLISRCKYLEPGERAATVDAVAQIAGVTLPDNLMMSGDQVRALHAAGMEIGAHTVSHPILTAMTPERAEREILESRDALATLTGASVRTFAYPNGKPGVDYDDKHVEAVRRAGFVVAVSTVWGAAAADHDRLQLPRVGFSDTSRILLALKLARAYGDAPSPAREIATYATH